jgi:hypothetical protein
MPSMDRGRVVVIPPKEIRQTYSLPYHLLDVHETGNRTIQVKWTIWHQEVYENPFHMNVIRNQLTRNLDIITPTIAHELSLGFDKWWGRSTNEWKDIKVWPLCLKIIAGAANSVFCGPPFCTCNNIFRFFHLIPLETGRLKVD